MKGLKFKILAGVVLLLVASIYYYVTLPAINIHSGGFWFFIILLLIVIAVTYILRKQYGVYEMKRSKIVWTMGILLILVILVFFIGAILSSEIVNAK